MKRDAQITFNKINQAAHSPTEECPYETCTSGNFTYCAQLCPITDLTINSDGTLNIVRD